MRVKGIHHISNIVYHPQTNIDYNTSVLGLKLLKKAVNFDDANTYHFYYGNDKAELGSVITAFPMSPTTKEGVKGGGQVNSIYYIIPNGTMDFWEKRLDSFNIETSRILRFNKMHLTFSDEAGINNELVESSLGSVNTYEYNNISSENAIKGFYGAKLHSSKYLQSKNFFIDILGMKIIDEDSNDIRFDFDSELGRYLDLSKQNFYKGNLSKGTVHHIAFSVKDYETLLAFKKKIENQGIKVTDIKNRDFFKSIYFKEPGGTVIELATADTGFADFSLDPSASKLYLPNHFEHLRESLEDRLTPVYVKPVDELKVYKYYGKDEYNRYYYHQNLLDEINALAKIAKERNLSDEEKEKRKTLRDKYVANIRSGFTELVDTIKVEDDKGKLNKIERKK